MVSLPIFAVATIFASTSVIGTGARSPSAAEICANDAAWADDDAGETAREFEEAFREFDQRFTAFSTRFTRAFGEDGGLPSEAETAELREAMDEVYRALAHLIPMRDAGNEYWPMKFLLEEMPGGVPLPDFDPPDHEEVLRAAVLRELVTVSLPGPERSKVRFLARLEMTRSLLGSGAEGAPSDSGIGALQTLAAGLLTESYEADFRRPALRVLDDGWHTSLASRLRSQVERMCEEARR